MSLQNVESLMAQISALQVQIESLRDQVAWLTGQMVAVKARCKPPVCTIENRSP